MTNCIKNGFMEQRMYQLNLDQTELAERANLSVSMISMVMSGKRKPSMSTLEKLSKVLRCKPGDFLEASTKKELKDSLREV